MDSNDNKTAADVARPFAVHQATVSRLLSRARATAALWLPNSTPLNSENDRYWVI
jgi:hypothetical protein